MRICVYARVYVFVSVCVCLFRREERKGGEQYTADWTTVGSRREKILFTKVIHGDQGDRKTFRLSRLFYYFFFFPFSFFLFNRGIEGSFPDR